MSTPVNGSTTTDTAPDQRAANRTLEDVVQMNFRSRQPASAPSATALNGPGPVMANKGTATPAPNEATPGATVPATETLLHDAAPADAAAVETAPGVLSESNDEAAEQGLGAPEAAGPEAGAPGAAEQGLGGPADGAPGDGVPDGPALDEPADGGPADGADPLVAEIAAAVNGKDVPKAIKLLTGRLGDVTRQLREAQTRAHEMERASLQQGEAPEPPAAVAGVAEAHPVIREIDGHRAKVLNALKLLDAHPQGGPMAFASGQPVLDEKGVQYDYTAEQVREMRFNYNERLTQLNEDRTLARQNLAQRHVTLREQTQTEARQLYPWLWDKTSREYSVAAQLVRETPAIKQNPQWEILIGRHVTGMLAEQARRGRPALLAKAPPMKAPKAQGPPAAVVTTPAVPARRVDNPAQKQIQEAQGKQLTVKDRAHLFALERQARTAAA